MKKPDRDRRKSDIGLRQRLKKGRKNDASFNTTDVSFLITFLFYDFLFFFLNIYKIIIIIIFFSFRTHQPILLKINRRSPSVNLARETKTLVVVPKFVGQR